MSSNSPIAAIYTDIGRGHPNYLDSVLRYIERNHPEESRLLEKTAIFETSRGMSLLGWQVVRQIYRLGARGGIVSRTYSRFRSGHSEYKSDSVLIKVLRRDLIRYFADYEGVCLVAHPLLANMLRQRHRVFYLHGEIAAPPESAVVGIERIYVPMLETAERMLAHGIDKTSIFETGLVLEPELCTDLEGIVDRRVERINRAATGLTIGFFISGSYPRRHSELMLKGARSLRTAGHRVRFFWGCDRRQAKTLMANVIRFDPNAGLDSSDVGLLSGADTVVVTGRSRSDETVRSMQYIPDLDIFCAAPHERVNWAVGAGLPMIMITPTIGTFAPENLDFVMKSGCGIALSEERDYSSLVDIVERLRHDGTLARMARSGRKIESVDGAKVIADDLIAEAKSH